jgi:alpha-glucosidase
MFRRFGMASFVFFVAMGCADSSAQQNAARQSATVKSPDGQVVFDLSAGGGVRYRVAYHGHPCILESPLDIELADGVTLGPGAAMESVQSREVNESYTQPIGKRSRIVNHCDESVITLRQREISGLRWQLIVRAYDDGVAFRYRFVPNEGSAQIAIARENDSFTFPDSTTGYALPLNSFTTSYEGRYTRKAVAEFPADWLLAMPLLVEIPGAGWAAVTEADLTDYAGMYLARAPGGGASLVSRLSPLPGSPALAVRAKVPHDSPWRVVMIGQSPGRLLESDLLLNLNKPSAIADTSSIHSGKTTFPWWNGFYDKDVPFQVGLNTATARYYIDFCAEHHIPYHSLDGKGSTAWYGGPITPYQGADIVQGTDGLDLQEVLRYAKEKGVRIRLWMHWGAAKAHMQTAFPLYEKWGIEGVMLDFMDRDDQEMIRFLREALETAAAHHLTITFHGVSKPTGLERTFPNLLSSEGAMNYEYDKWDKTGIPPEHDLTLVFTRMLAGPMDFHQGCLRGVPVDEFMPRNEAPLVMGTPCRMLATYVVFENHLSMVADYPSAYRRNPGISVIAQIPTTWDDTKVLESRVGKLAVVARRSGRDWWLGAMTDRNPADVKIPLTFLGSGSFAAEITHDDPLSPYRIKMDSRVVSASDSLDMSLNPAGGMVVHFSPQEK